MDGSSRSAVVVPAYDEAAVVGDVVASLRRSFDLVVCVDDGSDDRTADLARAAGARVLRHAVNLGMGAALQTGFDYVRLRTDATHVITFDADGQHLVQDALDMLAAARASGVDVLLGSRSLGASVAQPRARRLLLRAATAYSRASTGLAVTDAHCGLRVLHRRALEHVVLRQPGMAHASELLDLVVEHDLTWAEHPVTVLYTAHSRGKGQSNLNAFNIACDLALARWDSA